MKTVLYKRWIPAVWPEGINSSNCRDKAPNPGTGKYEDNPTQEGDFMGWGIGYEEINSGSQDGFRNIAHYTVALIQPKDGGCVIEVLPSNLLFIKY